MRLTTALLASIVLGVPVATHARPPTPPDRGERGGPPPMDRAQRERMLRKMHTMFVLELGEILGLDTAGTIKLSERLARHAEQRITLQLDNMTAMESLRRAAHGGDASVDAAGLARRVAQNRVQLAQVDQAELGEVLTGLSPDKAAQAAVLLASFPKRMEHLAGKARGRGHGRHGGPDGPPPGRGDDVDD
jgi:hypothetical protein